MNRTTISAVAVLVVSSVLSVSVQAEGWESPAMVPPYLDEIGLPDQQLPHLARCVQCEVGLPLYPGRLVPTVSENGIAAMCDAVGSKCVVAIALAGGGCAVAKAPMGVFGTYHVQACASAAESAMFGGVYGIPAGHVSGHAVVNHIYGSTTRIYRNSASCDSTLAWNGCGNTANAVVPDKQCLEATASISAVNGIPQQVDATVKKATPYCISPAILGLGAEPSVQESLNTSDPGFLAVVPIEALDPQTRADLTKILQDQFLEDFDRSTISWEGHPTLSAWKPTLRQQVLDHIAAFSGDVALREV
jgi:hypothetical protein